MSLGSVPAGVGVHESLRGLALEAALFQDLVDLPLVVDLNLLQTLTIILSIIQKYSTKGKNKCKIV